jgi:hypothetical protein
LKRDIYRTTYIDKRFNSQFYGFKIEISKIYSNRECNYEIELESLPGAILSIDKWWGALKTLYGWTLNARTNDEIISLKERVLISTNLNNLLNNDNCIILPSIVNRPKILLDIKNIKHKAISVKIDGFHKILFFCETGTYSCSPSLNINKINNVNFSKCTIVESEYISSTNQFFCFDILIYENNNVKNIDFEERYNYLKDFISNINIDNILYKEWYFPDKNCDLHEIINNNKLPIDGLMFQSVTNYDDDIYKWKPSENLTLDFYLQLTTDGKYDVYIFKSRILHKMEIKISDNIILLEDLHKKIVECRYVFENNSWEPIKVRYDKINPNSYEVVQNTMEILKNPLTLDDVINNL